MTIQVYHAKKPTFFDFGGTPNVIRDFDLVAIVETTDKNIAFQLTNSIDHAWFDMERPEGVHYKGSPDGCRSTSVGDVLVVSKDGINFETFVVAMCGFRKVEVL